MSNYKARILYVEDDETLSFVTKDNLEVNGYEVIHFDDGSQALDSFKKEGYDLCLLDVMLPEMDGFTLARHIRELDTDIPILFLTAKSLKEDRLQGFQLGGDDYITKPFSIEELILKIEVFLKRKMIIKTPESLQVGIFTYEHDNLKLVHGDHADNLTQKEGDLLLLLLQNREQILKRSQILKKLWGTDDYFLGRSMDVFISRLRKYLRPDQRIKIENIHSVGFRLTVETGGE
jgi:DNA-binding response OmpR family regulator